MKFILMEKEIDKIINVELSKNIYIIKIKKQEINLIYQELIDRILLKEVFKSLNKTLNNTLKYLTDEEDNEEETSKLYDELAKQRSIILKKYEKYLSALAKEQYLKKIRFLALELKKRAISYNYSTEKLKSR